MVEDEIQSSFNIFKLKKFHKEFNDWLKNQGSGTFCYIYVRGTQI